MYAKDSKSSRGHGSNILIYIINLFLDEYLNLNIYLVLEYIEIYSLNVDS